MKKLRVFQTVKIKRIVPGFLSGNLGTVLLFLLLVPYLVTFLFGNLKEGTGSGETYAKKEGSTEEGRFFINNRTLLGTERIPLESYVADKLARSMDGDYEIETLKAQAVLIRSGLLRQIADAGGNEIYVEDTGYGSIPATEKIYTAVSQTEGVCLIYENKPINGAYFLVSNGATRNAGELLSEEYPYLKSVLCSRDFLSEDYAGLAYYEENEFERLWQQTPSFPATEEKIMENDKVTVEMEAGDYQIYRDSVGYVLYLERDGKFVTGEQFRESLRIPSASFHLNKEENKILITSKGVGHGLGMSQFGANEMAKEGKDYVKILNYFFQDVTITKSE